ncbi:hypothetical protein JW964_24080 [candidate division KSB1 bacterium]|nr:hypothetical protein [candidate division KSB1 bacterium]
MQFFNDIKNFIKSLDTIKTVMFGYLSYIMLGWLILSLPFSQSINLSAIDNLFTVTSAVSTTGLATVSIAESYSFFGKKSAKYLERAIKSNILAE